MSEHHYTTLCRNDCPAVVSAFLERMVEQGIIGEIELARCGVDRANWDMETIAGMNLSFEAQPWHMDEDTQSLVNRETGRSWHIKELLYPRDLPTQHDKPLFERKYIADDPTGGLHDVMLFDRSWSKPFVLLWLIDNNYPVMDTPRTVGDGRDCSGAALANVEFHTDSLGYTLYTETVVIDV